MTRSSRFLWVWGLVLAFAMPAWGESADLRRSPIVEVVEKASPAVVNINTEQIVQKPVNPFYRLDPFFDEFFRDFFETFPQRRYKRQSLGSGVIIDKRGYIITNEHVILQSSRIRV